MFEVMLAQTFDPMKHNILNWYASEKFDGMRAVWDGGITRGIPTSQVPGANTAKDYRLLRPPISTGLWSRHGKPIHAPDWWLDKLPPIPLDGELYMGRGHFQTVMSVCKTLKPGLAWSNVQYMVFDSPTFDGPFESVQKYLSKFKLNLATQVKLIDYDHMLRLLDEVVDNKGEGLILRRPDSFWKPERSWDLLKVKKHLDAEATVIGFNWGKGKYQGMMGSLKCVFQGKEFELSGFTDVERMVVNQEVVAFPNGSVITFRYRELTKDGLPKEARYWRKNGNH